MTMVGLILPWRRQCCQSAVTRRCRRRDGAGWLGAGRLRIVRQMLTESVLLASMGGVLGVLLAMGDSFPYAPAVQRRADFTPARGLELARAGAAAALSVLTGVVFGLAPLCIHTRG